MSFNIPEIKVKIENLLERTTFPYSDSDIKGENNNFDTRMGIYTLLSLVFAILLKMVINSGFLMTGVTAVLMFLLLFTVTEKSIEKNNTKKTQASMKHRLLSAQTLAEISDILEDIICKYGEIRRTEKTEYRIEDVKRLYADINNQERGGL